MNADDTRFKKLSDRLDELEKKIHELENPNTTYRYVGMGTVLADKNDGSKFILVHLNEVFPGIEGDLSPLHDSTTFSGVDADGNEYSHTLQGNSGVKAIWKGDGNRASAPSVRQGQLVEVYQGAGSDKYFWHWAGNDRELMRAESAIYTYNASGAPSGGLVPMTKLNSYSLTIDPKHHQIGIATSKNNGEACGFNVQLNTKRGVFSFTDDLGNVFNIDGPSKTYLFKTALGGTIAIKGKDVTIEGSTLSFKFDNIYFNGNVLMIRDLAVNGKTTSTGITNKGDITSDTLNDVAVSSYQHS